MQTCTRICIYPSMYVYICYKSNTKPRKRQTFHVPVWEPKKKTIIVTNIIERPKAKSKNLAITRKPAPYPGTCPGADPCPC